MQPADIADLVTVGEPAVSPDGDTVAFVVTRVDVPANRYRSAVWLAASDGASPPYPLTAGEHRDEHPAWSPDGRALAFTTTRNEDEGEVAELRVAPVGQPGEVRTVCRRPERIGRPAWSPHGTQLAFTSRERTARYDAPDDAARPPRRITGLFTRLDGAGWIVDRPMSVHVVRADGTSPARVVIGGPYEHGRPAWTPDGRYLIVAAARHEDRDLDPTQDLFAFPVGGGDPWALTEGALSHSEPAVSRDGRIAALVDNVLLIPTHQQVVVLEPASGESVVLTAALDRQCGPYPGPSGPVWDGDELLFRVEDHGHVDVHRVPADGSAAPAPALAGGRVVTAFDAAGGTVAFVATSPTRLPELYVRGADGAERRLTDLGSAFLAAHPPRPTERFAVPSPAGDGDVDAWLVRPAGLDDDGRCPLLLSIHGGPMTQYVDAWFDEFQLWAGAGYAVLFCNPHGSTGHTDAWARAIRSPKAAEHAGTGWGGIDFDDVMAVLDAALERYGFLDAQRVGVLGGSYGGYLAGWAVGHTDRFAAACSERAVNNMLTLESTSDVAGTFRTEIGPSHLDDPDEYLRMSPLTHVRAMTTPMLLLHSEDDLRCPVEQADQLYVALRMLGRDVEYWRFPDEGHELSRTGSPAHRIQRAEIILDFFGRHLGESG